MCFYLDSVACLNLWNPGASLALSEDRWRRLLNIYIGWRKVRFVVRCWLASSGIGSHTKITLFAFNLIALGKKRRRWSVCLSVNLSNKHITKFSIFLILKNSSRLWLFLILFWPTKLSETEGLQIIEPFICDRLVFIYEDTATKRGFQ